MKDIKILGPGCKRCEATVELVKAEAVRLGIAVSVEKITDYAEIARYGVVSTPGVLVDGALVHAGGLPRPEAVAAWLKPAG